MPRRATSGVPGLTKKHERGCSKPKRLEKCDCAWRGSRKGHYNIVLHLWCREGSVNPRDKGAAQAIVERLRAVPDNEFDPAGERRTSKGGTSFRDFIQEWWDKDVVDDAEAGTYKLNISGLKSQVRIVKDGPLMPTQADPDRRGSGLGDRSVQDLADDIDGVEAWLNTTRKIQKWSGNTFNEYHRLLKFFFKRAIARRLTKFNPLEAIKTEKGVDDQRGELKHQRLRRDGLQQQLLDACPELNRTQCPNNTKLTQEKADAIRAAVEDGAIQKDLAEEYRVSRTVISQVVHGTIWNPERRVTSTKGDEMERRVLGAFDIGPRFEELTWFQLKHVRWNEFRIHPTEGHKTYKLVLPAHKTKGGKTTGCDEAFFATEKRHCKMLEDRREEFRHSVLRHNAYIYGTNDGKRVADFKKSWHALFIAAGLEYGVTFGRAVGLTWHTIKHEFASRAVETSPNLFVAKDRTRHRKVASMERYVHTDENAAWDAAMGGSRQR